MNSADRKQVYSKHECTNGPTQLINKIIQNEKIQNKFDEISYLA